MRVGNTQQQVTIEWADTVAQKWELSLSARLGYTAAQQRQLSREELCTHPTTCEHCCARVPGVCRADPSSPRADWAMCTTCDRRYHLACIERYQGTPAPEVRADWRCKECEGNVGVMVGAETADAALRRQCQHYLVQWEPTTEPLPEMCNKQGQTREGADDHAVAVGAAIRAALLEQELLAEEHRARAEHRPDSHLPAAQRQGIHAKPDTQYNKTVGERIRTLLHIHVDRDYDPHTDTEPLGAYTVCERTIEEGAAAQQVNVAVINAPSGATIATLPPNVLHRLRTWYQPGGDRTLASAAAASAEAHLKGTAASAGRVMRPARHLRQAIADIFACDKERFSDPYTALDTTQQYWSAHPVDAQFGAATDAYSVLWTGCSLSTPPASPAAAAKAVRWSLRSALHTSQPTLTVHILPDGEAAEAYSNYIRDHPQNVWRIAHVPRAFCRLEGMTVKGARCHRTATSAAPTGWNIILVGNTGALEAVHLGNVETPLLTAIARAATAPGHAVTRASLADVWMPGTHTLPKVALQTEARPQARLPPNMRRLQWDHCTLALGPHSLAAGEGTTAPRPPPPLRKNWREYAYTDGSHIKDNGDAAGPGLGAAVYAHGEGMLGELCIYIDPRPSRGGEHNIMRAELTALYAAVAAGRRHVMTDSQSCLNMIARALAAPHDLAEHRYNKLLRQLCELVQNADSSVHLYKVASHVGVVGNERADAMAVAVARGAATDNTGETLSAAPGGAHIPDSNDRGDTLWIHKREWAPPLAGGAAAPATAARVTSSPLANLGEGLRAAVSSAAGLGWATANTIYHSGFAAQLPNMHRLSFAFMTKQGAATWRQRRAALLYRTGTLYTGKTAKRFGYRDTDLCMAGCGQPDGVHHAVSGCPKLEAMRTKRHNVAGMILARALQRSGLAAQLHSADVGGKEEWTKDGVTVGIPPVIGRALLPRTLAGGDAARLAAQKPDIVLVETGGTARTVHLIEVKYARDAWPDTQEQRAAAQYEELAAAMRQVPGQRVRCHQIILGVGGSVYKATQATLKELGISHADTEATLLALHKHSVAFLQKTIIARRRLERGEGGARRRGAKRTHGDERDAAAQIYRGEQADGGRKHTGRHRARLRSGVT